ncbi:MAG: hypothetical protein ABT02_11680 [Comamonadaceae bacterium SCN 68-20]|jgi:hypothetical protein|nr:MAG: hypothetical protein ABT02_11680 [Comamonadaceae bacterium SCN 68-20]OJX04278.1 MAG: hypothetical protein BGO75_11955 [Burkholderiales bacterium 68-20]
MSQRSPFPPPGLPPPAAADAPQDGMPASFRVPVLTRAQREAMLANVRRLRELREQEHQEAAAARGTPRHEP